MLYVLMISSGLINGIAQILWKIGLDNFVFDNGLISIMKSLSTNTYFMLGVVLYVISIIIWLYVLSKVEVSIAYPFIAISYIIVILGGYFILGEDINLYKIIGVLLILGGIVFISRA